MFFSLFHLTQEPICIWASMRRLSNRKKKKKIITDSSSFPVRKRRRIDNGSPPRGKKMGHLKWRKRVLPPFSCSFKCFLNQVVFNRPKFLLCTIRNTETEACDNIVNLVYVRFFFFFFVLEFSLRKIEIELLGYFCRMN